MAFEDDDTDLHVAFRDFCKAYVQENGFGETSLKKITKFLQSHKDLKFYDYKSDYDRIFIDFAECYGYEGPTEDGKEYQLTESIIDNIGFDIIVRHYSDGPETEITKIEFYDVAEKKDKDNDYFQNLAKEYIKENPNLTQA